MFNLQLYIVDFISFYIIMYIILMYLKCFFSRKFVTFSTTIGIIGTMNDDDDEL